MHLVNNRIVFPLSFLLVMASSTAAAADGSFEPRKASTVQSSPFVWPNANMNEMIRAGVIQAGQVSMVESGAGLPWETQTSNKKRCAEEQLTLRPPVIELKVGEVFPVESLIVESSAFGPYYYDAAVTKKWRHQSDVTVLEKPSMVLRAVKPGETELTVQSLCKARGMKSPTPVVAVKVIVSAAQ